MLFDLYIAEMYVVGSYIVLKEPISYKVGSYIVFIIRVIHHQLHNVL